MEDERIETRFTAIYEQTYPAVLRYVVSKCGSVEDVRDILQDTYTDVFLSMKRKGCGHIRRPDAFVRKIAKAKIGRRYMSPGTGNICADDDALLLEESPEPSVDDRIVTAEKLQEIGRFLAAKPDDNQRIFVLFYVLGLSIPEIASTLSMHVSTVKTKLYRTRNELRSLYKEG